MDSGRTLQTARIPLAAFGAAELASIRAVRLTFDSPFEQGILLANIRATRATTPAPLAPAVRTASPGGAGARISTVAPAAPAPRRISLGNTVQSVRSHGADSVRITLATTRFFEPRARQLVLSVGAERSVRAAHPAGDLRSVEFLLPRAAFDRLSAREPLTVDYGEGSPVVWDFGVLDKHSLDR